MKQGKQTCRILKDIRRQIAEANDIEFITSECQYQGDCLGTCPKCEAEVRYLEQQLLSRQKDGLNIKVVGVSMSLAAMLASAPLYGQETKKDSTTNCIPQVEVVGKKPVESYVTVGMISNYKGSKTKTSKTKTSKTKTSKKEDAVFGAIEETMPEFPGGDKALRQYLANNIKYPKTDVGVSGRVITQFTITKKGKIVDAKVARSVHPLYDKEALRVIKKMPRWKPGTQRGKPVNTKFTIPVVFRSNNNESPTNQEQP